MGWTFRIKFECGAVNARQLTAEGRLIWRKKLGLYEGPYPYFGMLGAEMQRAVRPVVDTGLHSKGRSREKAM